MTDLSNLVSTLRSLARVVDRPRLVAMGWATVDGERAAAEVAGIEFGLESAETVLGARAWVAPIGSIALVLLEPSTEGRLAAFLARHGEALAALYLEADTGGHVQATAIGRAGRLLPHDRPWGPFVIAVRPTDDAAQN